MNNTRTSEDGLRAEIEDLKRQLQEAKNHDNHGTETPKGPSAGTLIFLTLLFGALIAAGFFFGYLPRQRREEVLAAESKVESQTAPIVTLQPVTRSSTTANLVLPGNVQAITEGPVLARSSGYIKKRYVDIGDRVKENQVLAEIEAPELGQQIKQAQAAVDQAGSTVQQSEAALEQGKSNLNLAKVTAERWRNLLAKGVVSRQENDTYQAQYEAQQANVQALEKAIAAAKSNVAAAEANLARLNQLLEYQTVRAPFAGVITLRNVDSGVLVTDGSTLLFRIAQTDRLRTYLNVPQADAESVRVGQQATLTIPDQPGVKFMGTVARTANALDPATRTLLVEVQVPNPTGKLLPGAYTEVDLAVPRKNPPLLIPASTLVVRNDGPQAAVVSQDGAVHFARVQLGRDLGDHLEVLSGLEEGQQLVVNPSDLIREGVTVRAAGSASPGPTPGGTGAGTTPGGPGAVGSHASTGR
ncbi:MAG TPA: efflux RND transporter periplasmic adaptor subunit [Bryobacteraceae bacterium]|nr:efflux RND transporter periplasmic adaptor subunit [Bryobacteraceae bacterium]